MHFREIQTPPPPGSWIAVTCDDGDDPGVSETIRLHLREDGAAVDPFTGGLYSFDVQKDEWRSLSEKETSALEADVKSKSGKSFPPHCDNRVR